MEAFLLEKATIKAAGEPVDLSAAAFTGARVKLDKGFRLSIVAHLGDSTAGTVVFNLQQHDAATGGTSKALSISNKYYHKVGSATKFTQVVPTTAASSYDLSTLLATEPGIVVFEVLPEDLDVNDNFAWVSVNIPDTGTATKLGSILYVLHEVKEKPAYEIAL